MYVNKYNIWISWNKIIGLAAYDDCSSATESENDESYLSKRTSDQSESGNDSEEEIRVNKQQLY